ncbi:hypothetical protein AB6E04_01425 [Vibrio amylolyticus]|uniref:BatD family protein n=1 Tax=Vibrio amylolyticus TaxID=2847292 RepID=UPI00354F7D38
MPFLICIASMVMSGQAFALNIHDLLKSNDVELVAWVGDRKDLSDNASSRRDVIVSDRQYSVNEQVILTIEVATPRWLTGGTRIGSVEVPNLIAKQRNLLATNYTERKDGQTWSRQRWEVTLYPLSSGVFVIPRIAVQVQVSAPDGSNVAGTLYTPPIQFEATLPSGRLSDSTPWFSATDVEVKQTWQQSSEEIKVGGAITRKVEVRAKDSLSILLPDLLEQSATPHYQTYPQPHILDDTQERGDYRSSRIEESIYVIQQGGEFTLPDYQFQWWNSETKTLETVTVEGQSFFAAHTVKSFVQAYRFHLSVILVTILTLAGAVIVMRRYYRDRPTPEWLIFRRLMNAKDWPRLRTLVYRQLRLKTSALTLSLVDRDPQWQSDSSGLQQGKEDPKIFKRLWRSIRHKSQRRSWLVLPKALPSLDAIVKREHRPSDQSKK